MGLREVWELSSVSVPVRLVGLGLRRSRFFGREKTQVQALLAAAVANFTLLAGWMGSEGGLCGLVRRVRGRLRAHRAFKGLMTWLRVNRKVLALPAAA